MTPSYWKIWDFKLLILLTHFLLEPFDRLLLVHPVRSPNSSMSATALGDASAGTAKHHVEVHPVNADRRVVLDAQINVLLDAKTEVAGVREVFAIELVFFDLMNLYVFNFGLGEKTFNPRSMISSALGPRTVQ